LVIVTSEFDIYCRSQSGIRCVSLAIGQAWIKGKALASIRFPV